MMIDIFNTIEFIKGGQVFIGFFIFIIAYGLYTTRKDKKKSEGIGFAILSCLMSNELVK